MLKGKKIVLGISGGIAAYKSPELIRGLKKMGAEVFVIMTESAKEFVTPLVLETVSGNPVSSDLFELGGGIRHIDVVKEADCVLVAPATANTIGKYANGIADNLLLTTLLAAKGAIVLCPAMNSQMWEHVLVQENLEKLKGIGVHIVEPDEGELACGVSGPGRLPDVDVIIKNVFLAVNKSSDLKGKKVLITAGATREYADPVRFLTNDSSGKMGVAFALVAKTMGAEVAVVMGPSKEMLPMGIDRHDVVSGEEMRDIVLSQIEDVDVFVATAAVCDYRFGEVLDEKISKTKSRVIELVSNVDVLYEASRKKKKRQFFVGFALETEKNDEKVREKLDKKRLNCVVCDSPDAIGGDFFTGYLLTQGSKECFDELSKLDLARYVFRNYCDGKEKTSVSV